MNDRIFTPFENPESNRRLELKLSDEDWPKIRRGHWGPEQVTDLTTGTVVSVQGASCGEPACYCAAEVVEIVTEGSEPMKLFNEGDS